MGHDATNHPPGPVDLETAQLVAETMHALATPSRVLILSHLRDAPTSVGELANAIGMDQSAVSHQLRVLRHLGLVTARRDGRSSIYALHDEHVAELVDQAVHHVAHRRLGLSSDAAARSRHQESGSSEFVPAIGDERP